MGRGFFAIGVEHTKTKQNVGTLWRSANLYWSMNVAVAGSIVLHDRHVSMKGDAR